MKRDDNEHDEHEPVKSNLRRKAFKHRYKRRHLSVQHYRTLGVIQRGTLRTIDSDQDFTYDEIMEEEVKILSDDVM